MAKFLTQLDDDDRPEIERHLLTLDPVSRYARFGSAFPDAWVSGYVRRIDLGQALLVGAIDEADGRIVGLAEAQPTGSPARVEMAVSVHAPHRRQGLGRTLVTQAMHGAFFRGAEVAEFIVARDNRAIIGLIRSLGGQFAGSAERAEISRAATCGPRPDLAGGSTTLGCGRLPGAGAAAAGCPYAPWH